MAQWLHGRRGPGGWLRHRPTRLAQLAPTPRQHRAAGHHCRHRRSIIGEYWEAAAVTFLFLFGAYLEARTLNHTRQVLQGLLALAPTTAIVLRSGQQTEVMPHEVVIGETVLVKPGAKVPVDGRVIDGRSAIDESAITGESIPVEKTAGTAVYAGTVNQAGLLKVAATGVGADTTLARIIRPRRRGARRKRRPPSASSSASPVGTPRLSSCSARALTW
ncbi:MAG: HAD-IC family P-type ATPase [Chloroflexi bacterium]|nr:HAD-IC family P-type ATPase [Chloroflexota bacterium]